MLASVHPVFHVSILKKCIGDLTTSIVTIEGLGVKENLSYEEVLVEILDRQEIEKQRSCFVKGWTNHLVEDATWRPSCYDVSISSPFSSTSTLA